jgi:hypothetical protein
MRRLAWLAILVAGCDLTTGGSNKPDDKTVVDKESHWTCLADEVADDKSGLDQTDKLIDAVKRLRDRGCITDAEVDAFYAKFPGIKTTQRPIDHTADANLLRSL